MPRSKVRDIAPPEPIRPVAAPVDTYVRPADPAPSSLHDVANGLAAFDKGLQAFLSGRMEKQNEQDRIRGEAAFHRNNAVGWSEAVKRGLVPPNASPIFMESYKGAQGNLAGIRLQETWNAAYGSWEGRNTDNPAEFDAFLNGFIKDNIGTEDPAVLKGLLPHIRGVASSGHEQWMKERADAAYSGSVNTHGALSGEHIDQASSDGLSSPTGTDYDGLWGGLMAQREAALKSGIRTADYDAMLVDTIISKAIEHGDPELLQLLDKDQDGDGHALSAIPEFRDKKLKALDKLTGMAHERMAYEEREQAKKDKAAEEAIVRGTLRKLYEDPNADIPEEVLREWEKYDPKARVTAMDLRKSLLEGGATEDPSELLRLYEDIRNGGTEQDIIAAVGRGTIRTHTAYKAALDYLEKYQKARESGSSITTAPTAQRYKAAIKTRTATDPVMDILGVAGMTDAGLQATQDFELALLEWDAANPGSSQVDREKAINEIGRLYLERVDEETRQYAPLIPQRPVGDQPVDGTLPDPQRPSDRPHSSASETPGKAAPETAGEHSEFTSDQLKRLDAMGVDPSDFKAFLKAQGGGRNTPQGWSLGGAKFGGTTFGGHTFGGEKHGGETYGASRPDAGVSGAAGEDETQGSADPGTLGADLPVDDLAAAREAVGGAKLAYADQPGTMTDAAGTALGDAIEQAYAAPHQQTMSEAIDAIYTASRGTHSTDPAVRRATPLLDLLGRSEGTDKGRGYNETLGYGAYTGGDVELTSMTLGEIDKLQTKMLRHPDNEWNSSALGRYQIVRTTLRKLKKSMGLSDDEVFTPELQDRMALQLMKGRGLDKWLAGRMSDTVFMEGLAKEWASVPMRGGKGYYGGQRAGVPVEAVMSALEGIRSGRGVASVNADTPSLRNRVIPKAYARIPKDELDQFMEWNSDPVANHEANLQTVDKTLAGVVRRAQEISKVKFVVGSGKRGDDLQAKAVGWGWSWTKHSDHLDGTAVDLWGLDGQGAITFDLKTQKAIIAAMRQAADELGVKLDFGERFGDNPHFALKGQA